jgi:hypothetical protein
MEQEAAIPVKLLPLLSSRDSKAGRASGWRRLYHIKIDRKVCRHTLRRECSFFKSTWAAIKCFSDGGKVPFVFASMTRHRKCLIHLFPKQNFGSLKIRLGDPKGNFGFPKINFGDRKTISEVRNEMSEIRK